MEHIRQQGHTFVAAVAEYGEPAALIGELAVATGKTNDEVQAQFVAAGARLQSALRLAENPIEVNGLLVRVRNVAGLVRVSPEVHLEVAPKFLSIANPSWREDFFLAATLSKYGRLLPSERLGVTAGARANLSTLVGKAIVEMFASNARRPLRTYRRNAVQEFALDGDVDAESLWFPSDEGYDQHVIVFDNKNKFNSVVFSAVDALIPDVADPGVRNQLARIRDRLAPQRRVPHAKHVRLPGRAMHWQPLFDLSVDVLNGFSAKYEAGALFAPGYAFETWRVWQDLVTLSLRLGTQGTVVSAQASSTLGVRDRKGKKSPFNVIPDVVVRWDALTAIVDAKYKGRADTDSGIVEADLYEALAFAKATASRQVVLVYPDPRPNTALGLVDLFETVVVGGVTVHGITIATTGLATINGLQTFADGLGEAAKRLAS